MSKFTDNLSYWENIYSQKRHLNIYPFDEIVSLVFSNFGINLTGIHVLELGCGAGNNLWFAARHGAEVVGIDGSKSAINFCKKRFADEKLNGNFIVQNFKNMQQSGTKFDLVIDRAALTTMNFENVQTMYRKVFKVLKPGGLFYSQLYSSASDLHGDYIDGVYKNLQGLLEDCGDIALFTKEEIYKLVADNKIINLDHTIQNKIEGQAGQSRFAYWSIVLQRK